MKLQSFDDYIEKRLNPSEIEDIKKKAQIEAENILKINQALSQELNSFLDENNKKITEISSKLGESPTKLNKIKQGKANLTLSSLAHFAAMMDKKVNITFD